MSTPTPFQHAQMDDPTQQIRLIHLSPPSPSNPDQPIHATLQTVFIHSAPEYLALSYTWGAPTPTQTIHLNNQPFPIRSNLYTFLQTAVYHTPYWAKPLWIDQISINQHSKTEVTQQVHLMADIFRRAVAVIAWVGPGGVDFNMLTYEGYEILNHDMPPGRSVGLLRLRAFLDREYWSRLWVVQELVLAKTILFLCGSTRFTWQTLEGILSEKETDAWNARFFTPLFLHRVRVGRIADGDVVEGEGEGEWRRKRKMVHLHEVITSYYINTERKWLCARLHDRIYGLMALADESQRLVVDYDLEPEELYKQVLDLAMQFYTQLARVWFQVPRPAEWQDQTVDDATLGHCVWRVANIAQMTRRALELGAVKRGVGEDLEIWRERFTEVVGGGVTWEVFRELYEKSLKAK